MKLKYGFGWVLLSAVLPFSLWGQDRNVGPDIPQHLDSVLLKTNRLSDFSVGQWVQRIPSSELNPNRASLNSLLHFTTPIYFKENGLGMVSSPSFRGTTASQTAVLWNGISINSNFNGQLDFNTMDSGNYDEIEVRSGGGSLLYGSSALGGTIHLRTQLAFKDEFSNRIYSSYGSFRTWNNKYQLKLSNTKWSFRLTGIQNSSSNDYKYHKSRRRNRNGEYRNYSVDAALGYKINSRNTIFGYGQIYKSNRHFPVFYASENPSGYRDFDIRTMLEWESKFGPFRSNLKTAFLKEEYRYYENRNRRGYTYGKTNTIIGKYNLQYKIWNTVLLNGFVDYQHAVGEGSDIGNNTRDITALGLIFRHDVFSDLSYQVGGRKEITNTYESPFLYTVGVDYSPFDFYQIKISASKNFRRPTFNDLFWTNSGNTELKAEQSHQIEWGNHFSVGDWRWSITGYFNDITDMIHWIPASGGLFKPRNENHVQTYGIEAFGGWKKNIAQHHLNLNTTYAYTVSRDKRAHQQLIYVPYHKATLNLVYRFNRLHLDYQFLYNGRVYLRSDNHPEYMLSDYTVSNLSGSYNFGKRRKLTVGGKIRNLFNVAYENVERYEMPGINFSIFANLKL